MREVCDYLYCDKSSIRCILYIGEWFPHSSAYLKGTQLDGSRIPLCIQTIQCLSLENVTDIHNLPDNVTKLRIINCPNLINITIPNSIKHFECKLCPQLTSLIVPRNISWFECNFCVNLTTIHFARVHMSKIDIRFADCDNLKTINNMPILANYILCVWCRSMPLLDIESSILGHYIGYGNKLLFTTRMLTRCQKQFKRKRNSAIQDIQDSCEDWLWKPVCKDSSYGINLTLGLEWCDRLSPQH